MLDKYIHLILVYQLLASSCDYWSVWPRVAALFPLDGFPWKLIFGTFFYEDLSRNAKFCSNWTKIPDTLHENHSHLPCLLSATLNHHKISCATLLPNCWQWQVAQKTTDWWVSAATMSRERANMLRNAHIAPLVSTLFSCHTATNTIHVPSPPPSPALIWDHTYEGVLISP